MLAGANPVCLLALSRSDRRVLALRLVRVDRAVLCLRYVRRYLMMLDDNMLVYITMYLLGGGGICSLFSDLFSRSRLRGTQGARLYTTAQVWVPAGSVACALGVQSREIWQVITGLLSAGATRAEQNN